MQDKNKEHVFDVAIIGGGINGCGCAADAALRGLSVVLIEQDDIASKTSSKSTKLIHGGLRYLEYYDFKLVKKALDERQTLLQLAPYLIHPQAFVIPYQKNLRPSWMLRIGLFLYDHLSFINKLPRSKLIKRRQQSNYFHPLNDAFNTGFIYYDCYADDARLTLVNALQAKQHGASILPQTKLVNAEVKDGLWQLMLQSKDGALFQIQTKAVINTAGPWVETITQLLKIPLAHSMTLVKGSHLVVKKLYEGQHAYMLQHDDKRIVFVIPYHGYSMVGTTDVLFQGDINTIQIDDSEINYLCSLVNYYFNKPLSRDDIITTWSGVRPLLSDPGTKPSALSRDYTYHYTNVPAPAITVFGGKITTYRQLAVQVIDQLKIIYPDLPESSTAIMALPGATLNDMNFMDYQDYARKKYNWLDKEIVDRYLKTYGTLTEQILGQCHQMADLGICFTCGLYQVEVDYLIKEEWVSTSEDILWRRTKLGLVIGKEEEEVLVNYLLALTTHGAQ